MTTDPERLKSTFLEAAEQAGGAARAAYLDRACGGDAGLRGRVEALLRSHDPAGSFLATPAATAPEAGRPARAPDGASEALRFLTPTARPGSLGRLGHYEVLEVLGKGGFGTVVRAFDDTLQRVVAIKLMAPELAATSAARQRFLREARASAQVRHENVVRVYAVEEQPLPHLVMEFIPGETLQQRLDRAGPLGVEEVVRVGRQLAEGLAAAHATGLVHRDIKPANVLIEAGPSRHVKITDFGLARAADDASLTQSGVIAGTPLFMAPEQARGEALDHRADLFSLGSVLYTMCSGRAPFRAAGTLAVLKRVAEDTPRPIPEIAPEVPPWLCDLIARLHAKDPGDRVGTAREVADLLERGPAAPASRRPRARSRRWAVAATLLLAAGGLSSTEASGVTDVRGTVTRLFSPQGTLVVEVDDPGVSVQIDGADLVITGAGAKAIRLKPGDYTVEARKGGQVVSRELVAVTRDGRRVVRVSQEATPPGGKTPPPAAPFVHPYVERVAALPAADQAEAVRQEFVRRNADFGGVYATVTHKVEGGVVTEFAIRGVGADRVSDISAVRALAGLRSFGCNSSDKLSDLSPLKGLRLTTLRLSGLGVSDLSVLKGMDLTTLRLCVTSVKDLSPLKDIKTLTTLDLNQTPVADLSPLAGTNLTALDIGRTSVSDLSPLAGLKLKTLRLDQSSLLRDLSPLQGLSLEEVSLTPGNFAARGLSVLRAMKSLKTVGVRSHEKRSWPAAEFWARYDAGEFQ